MARPIRIQFEGAVYHVTARGNERREIFRSDTDRARFVSTLEECVVANGLVLHAWCLMPNHYHLLIETPRGNLSRAVGWLQTTYTVRFNRRHGRSGHLFQGRFKAHLVEADSYAMELIRYIHLNPDTAQEQGRPRQCPGLGEARRLCLEQPPGLQRTAGAPRLEIACLAVVLRRGEAGSEKGICPVHEAILFGTD